MKREKERVKIVTRNMIARAIRINGRDTNWMCMYV